MNGLLIHEQIMVDPSLALTGQAVEWFTNPELAGSLVVSRAFLHRLRDRQFDELAEFNPELAPGMPEALIRILDSIRTFSFEEATDLRDGTKAVRDALLQLGPLGEIYADEWVFLFTHSTLAIRERIRRTVDAFNNAGARVFMATGANLDAFLARARVAIPAPVFDLMKAAGQIERSKIPLFVFGGLAAELLLPPLALPLHITDALAVGVGLIAGDP
jgi:hypothetical protein